SIIEVSYTTHSYTDSNLPAWSFQGVYPRLWTEYNVSIPEWYNFVFLRQGYYTVNESHSDRRENFSFRYEPDGPSGRTENVNVEARVTDWRFISHNMPALRPERYTTTLRNHVQSIEFQLGSSTIGGVTRNRMGSWPALRESLMNSDYFGATIDKNNGFLADVVSSTIAGANTEEEKGRRLYAYVQQNYTCTEDERMSMDATTVKTVFNNKKGNSAELNLLLVALLRRAGLQAWPIILSTRDHGVTFELYPILHRFNYTVTYLKAGDNEYVMDASKPLLGFNHLPLDCYNGHARLLTPEMPAVFFYSDSLREQSITSVMAALDSAGGISGTYQQIPGYYTSYHIRQLVKDQGREAFFKSAGKAFASDALISEPALTYLDSLEKPLLEKFDFKISGGDEDHIYLTPLWGEAQKENPFTAAERRYPVEIPYLINEVYTLNLVLPANYEIEELPKPAVVKLNEVDGVFQYLLQGNAGNLQLRCVVRLNRANFAPGEYNDLREFYNYIVKKEAEQIVLKKKA
ncbi:MAG TPA: transglutaminase domain-containing protein, partial [Chitinophaga sp.]